ncbi:MAG: hypothetical protein U0802_01390 [Candidatus Binatia bacterium]
MSVRSPRPKASLWTVWAPLPLLLLALLDWSFPQFFWRLPKITGRSADYGYQFLLDAHEMERGKPPAALRVLAVGSSVAGSFDPAQVQSLLQARLPDVPIDVHRLLKPSMKPSDYRLFFASEVEALRPDVVVIMFALQDFLHSNFERDIKPDIQDVLPPWPTLRDRHQYIPVSQSLQLLLASGSNFYRYRHPLRSTVEDHARALAAWLRSPGSRGGYGVYPDGYTRRRFGLPVRSGTHLDLEYFVNPAWIQQRGAVTLDFALGGQPVARRTETEAGWKTLSVDLPGAGPGVLQVVSDSTWNPRAAGTDDDLRLLGVQLRPAALAQAADRKAPFHYPPLDDRDVDEFLRMGGATGDAFVERWRAALDSNSDFGTRLRAWRDTRESLRDSRFEPTDEFRELANLVDDLTRRGISVILVNTPENPLLTEYQNGPFYHGYRDYFRDLAEARQQVWFYDLLDLLPAQDFNDVMHVSYVGMIKAGPEYADMIERAIRARAPAAAGAAQAHVDELRRAALAPEQDREAQRAVGRPARPDRHPVDEGGELPAVAQQVNRLHHDQGEDRHRDVGRAQSRAPNPLPGAPIRHSRRGGRPPRRRRRCRRGRRRTTPRPC